MNKPLLSLLGAATVALSACGQDPTHVTPRNPHRLPPPVVAGPLPPTAPVEATSPAPDAPTPGEPTPEEPTPEEPMPGQPTPGGELRLSELRVVGVNAAAFRSVLLPVHSVQVTAGGQPVTFTPAASGHLELAGAGPVLGTIGVPEGVDTVQVELVLDAFGSFVDAGTSGQSGPLDTRVRPLRFEVATASLRQGRPAVLTLDVGRSVVQHEGARVLLPQLMVRY